MGIDIGGTKTLVARLNNAGVIKESTRFPTPKNYTVFLRELAKVVADITTDDVIACTVAAPGLIDRTRGVVKAFGNLPWRDVPLKQDVERILSCPTLLENDANLAGLSESKLLTQYPCVLYVTVSTGIGTGIIKNQEIDPEFADSEGGHIMLEEQGQLKPWEEFASGRAIVRKFGKRAGEIDDDKTWRIITKNIALGLFDLCAFIQPDVIVLGGGVMTHFERFDDLLLEAMKKFETPLTPIPPIVKAQRPEEAVIYGCYDLAKGHYDHGRHRSQA